MSTNQQSYSGKRAVVVGAGPSGSVAAAYLARHGFHVDVYERSEAYAEGTKHMAVGPRSYSVVLNRRGMEALEGAGLGLPPGGYVHCSEASRFRPGSKRPMTMKMNQWSNAVNRGTLAGHLASEAQRQHPGKVAVHYGRCLLRLDLAARKAVFVASSSSGGSSSAHAEEEVVYDLLIGADGVSSRVREAFAEQLPGFSFTQVRDDMEYKALLLPGPLVHGGKAYEFYAIHDQKRNASLLTPPSADGSQRGVFIMEGGEHGRLGASEQAYVAAMKQSFPFFTEEQYRAMAEQLAAAPVSNGGTNIRCSSLAGPAALLLGDAAHAMWPSLGQGANCALEDCVVLDAVLQEAQGDPARVPGMFSEVRHEDVLAAVDLTEGGFGGRRRRTGATGLSYPVVKLVAQLAAHQLLPGLVPRPALMTLNDTTTRYSVIKRRAAAQSRAMDWALRGTAVAAAALALRPLAASLVAKWSSAAT